MPQDPPIPGSVIVKVPTGGPHDFRVETVAPTDECELAMYVEDGVLTIASGEKHRALYASWLSAEVVA